MINISLPDGSVRSFDKPVSGAEIAASIGPGLAKAALALRVDGKMKDLASVVDHDAKIGIVTSRDPEALELLRHDAAHVLAQAVQELYPGTQITFGPATEDGFYYDFVRAEPFSPEDFAKIEQRMAEIVDRNLPITREVWDRARIKEYFLKHGESFKAEWADELPKDEEIYGLQAGRLARHVPRPAPALDGQARQGVQADEGVGRLLARRRQERPAPARLRHGLLLRQGPQGLPAPHRGSREARPSPDRPRDGPLPSAGRSRRHGVLASQGLDVLAHARGLPPAQARGRRLCRGEDAAARRPQAVGSVGPLGEVPREHVSQRERGRPARVHRRSGASASSR